MTISVMKRREDGKGTARVQMVTSWMLITKAVSHEVGGAFDSST